MIDESGTSDGIEISRGKRSTRRKPAPIPFVHHEPHMTWDRTQVTGDGKPATNRLTFGTS
jgi:hypothetical protein